MKQSETFMMLITLIIKYLDESAKCSRDERSGGRSETSTPVIHGECCLFAFRSMILFACVVFVTICIQHEGNRDVLTQRKSRKK